jgi:hypothetical protein
MSEAKAPDAPFDGFKKTAADVNVDAAIAEHCRRFNIEPLEAAKLFPVLARRQWLKRFLAHAELFRRTLDVPGDIAELGVYRGLGLLTWANLLESYAIGDRTKMVYGFDNWAGFRSFSPQDGGENAGAHKVLGGFDPSDFRAELEDAIAIFDTDRFIPWKARTELIDGDIEHSVPAFIEGHPGVRFSLVHFDCDLYAPTLAGLEAIWPRVSRGGLILFDEYAIADWPGETQAVDEFLASRPDVRVQTLSWTNAPAGFIVKP